MEKNLTIRNSTVEFLIFQLENREDGVQLLYADETLWLTQDAISLLFDKGRSTIAEHLQNIFASGELAEDSVCRKFRQTAADGKNYQVKWVTRKISWACNHLTCALTLFSLSICNLQKKDLSSTEDITFAMRNRQEWFNEKMAAISPEIVSEVQLSADIIARIDAILKQKNMTQKDLARKMGRSEAAISRWTSGFPNLTLKSIAEISTALGEPLIKVTE